MSNKNKAIDVDSARLVKAKQQSRTNKLVELAVSKLAMEKEPLQDSDDLTPSQIKDNNHKIKKSSKSDSNKKSTSPKRIIGPTAQLNNDFLLEIDRHVWRSKKRLKESSLAISKNEVKNQVSYEIFKAIQSTKSAGGMIESAYGS